MTVYVLIRDNFGIVSVDSIYASPESAQAAEGERKREQRIRKDRGGYISMTVWRIEPHEVQTAFSKCNCNPWSGSRDRYCDYCRRLPCDCKQVNHAFTCPQYEPIKLGA